MRPGISVKRRSTCLASFSLQTQKFLGGHVFSVREKYAGKARADVQVWQTVARRATSIR